MFQRLAMAFGLIVSVAVHAGIVYLIYIFPQLFSTVSISDSGEKYIIAKVVSMSELTSTNSQEKPAPQPVQSEAPQQGEQKEAGKGNKSVDKNLADHSKDIKKGSNTKQKTNTTDEKTALKSGRAEESTKQKAGGGGEKDDNNTKEVKAGDDKKKNNGRSPEEQKAVESRVQAYVKRINQALVENWSRPSNINAGENITVSLQLTLNPDGTVADVVVSATSGNELFDRSALVAVKKITKFAVPSNPEMFNDYFKNITLQFTNPSE